MIKNLKLIIYAILSLVILFLLSNLSKVGDYYTENVVLSINDQNISAQRIIFYKYGCYKLNSSNSYFIIHPVDIAINFNDALIFIDYLNTSDVIICNENIVINETVETCIPIACTMNCNENICYPCNPFCYNKTYYINISYPILIVKQYFDFNNFIVNLSIGETYIISYNNNLYCIGECEINVTRLSDDYLDNLIRQMINYRTNWIILG
ncbi:MAG: hypothetical protein ACP5G1_00710 [Nanopusillaceae archaeon]